MKKQYSLFIIIVSFLLNTLFLFSQDSEGNHFNSYYIDPSVNQTPETPNAANFTVYGKTPVNPSTGLPEISIPIYTIEEDGVQVPIAISYHASGVKVDEISSTVGLKWTLNAGGGIFRTVNDMDDLMVNAGWAQAGSQSHFEDWMDYYNPTQQFFEDHEKQELIELEVEGTDQWPDNFNYNFLGFSGDFMFKPNGELLKGLQDDITIIPDVENPNLNHSSFIARDQKGTMYYFSLNMNNKERNHTGYQYLNYTENDATIVMNRESHITGWMLDRIHTKNDDYITFEYENTDGPSGYYNYEQIINPVSQRIFKTKGCGYCELGYSFSWDCESDRPASYSYYFLKGTILHHESSNALISKISTDNVEVRFEYVTGPINGTIAVSGWDKRIDKIIIKDKIENKEKRFEFTYGVFQGEDNFNRLKLTEIQEIGFDDTSKPPYKFTYDETYELPLPGSFSKDYKGYYNGKDNSSLIPRTGTTLKYHFQNPHPTAFYQNKLSDRYFSEEYLTAGVLKTIEYPTGGKTEFFYEANAFGENLEEPMIAKNSFDINTNLQQLNIAPYYTFNTLKKFDDVTSHIKFNVTSSFCPYCTDVNCSNIYEVPLIDIYEYNGSVDDPTILESNIGDLVARKNLCGLEGYISIGADGSYTFDETKVYLVQLKIHNTTYDVNNPDFLNVALDYYQKQRDYNGDVVYQKDYLGGLRIRELMDKDENNNISNRKRYIYHDMYLDEYSRLSHLRYIKQPGVGLDAPTTISSGPMPVSEHIPTIEGYLYTKIEIREQALLKGILESNGKIIEEYKPKIVFNTLKGGDIKRRQVFNSEDKTLELSEYIYPEHSPIDSLTFRVPSMQKYPVQFWIDCMPPDGGYFIPAIKSAYGMDMPTIKHKQLKTHLNTIKTTKFLKKSSTYHPVTTIQDFEYNEDLLVDYEKTDTRYTGTLQPNSSMSYTLDNPNGEVIEIDYTYPKDYPSELTDLIIRYLIALPIGKEVKNNGTKILGQFFEYDINGNIKKTFRYNKGQGSNNSPLNYIPSNYEEMTSYLYEDGNPVQARNKDGQPVSFIWGYNKQYPVAKVENVTYSQATNVSGLNMSVINNPSSDAVLRDEIDKIRQELPQAMVTTYTYKPLVGMTSQTDPKGDIIKYYYDDFGRLEYIKDKQGRVIEEFEYNYKDN